MEMQLGTQPVRPIQFAGALQVRIPHFDEELRESRVGFSETPCGIKGEIDRGIGTASWKSPSVESRQASLTRNGPLRAARAGRVTRIGNGRGDSSLDVHRQLSPNSEVRLAGEPQC